MSCCPKAPEIFLGGSADSDAIGPSAEMNEGESIECFVKRAGNATGRLDDKTEPVADTIENNDIPMIKGYEVDVTFRLTPNSTKVATSWTYVSDPPLPAGVTFTGNKLKGSFPKESYGKRFNLKVTAEPAINTRAFVFAPAKATGSNSISFIHPLPGSRVTSTFGYRVAPKAGASTQHKGVDFSSPGDKRGDVLAAADGMVIFRGTYTGGGNVIVIQHYNAANQQLCTTKYMHLERFYVAQNQVVVKGQKIGKEGNTGVGTAAHLHFECLLPNQTNIDPLPLIKGSVTVATVVTPENQPAPGTPLETRPQNGALTPENAQAKESGCPEYGDNYPKPKGYTADAAIPAAPPGDPFEKAWFFTMYHETGPQPKWSTASQSDPEVIQGLTATPTQRAKVGLVTKKGFPGGVTKFGIAQTHNTDLKVELIDYATAKKRGYNGYWKGVPSSLAATKPKTAIMMFDICYLHGPGNGRSMAKRANIEALSDDEAYVALSKEQYKFITSLPNADSYRGWFTRNADLLAYVKGLS